MLCERLGTAFSVPEITIYHTWHTSERVEALIKLGLISACIGFFHNTESPTSFSVLWESVTGPTNVWLRQPKTLALRHIIPDQPSYILAATTLANPRHLGCGISVKFRWKRPDQAGRTFPIYVLRTFFLLYIVDRESPN